MADNEKVDFDECALETPCIFWGFSLKQKTRIFFTLRLFIGSLVNIIFGSGLLCFLSHEILMKKVDRLVNDSFIAKEYGFPNSFISYYPAWMETLEARGGRSVLFFYSSNCLPYVK